MSTRGHYERAWGAAGTAIKVLNGPMHELPDDFAVLEFPPRAGRNMWTYATCGMSLEDLFESSDFNFIDPCRASLCEEKHDGA
jgi:hypothetical protein